MIITLEELAREDAMRISVIHNRKLRTRRRKGK